jgi:hypothetical protein
MRYLVFVVACTLAGCVATTSSPPVRQQPVSVQANNLHQEVSHFCPTDKCQQGTEIVRQSASGVHELTAINGVPRTREAYVTVIEVGPNPPQVTLPSEHVQYPYYQAPSYQQPYHYQSGTRYYYHGTWQ